MTTSKDISQGFTACRELMRLLYKLGIKRWRHPGSKALLDYTTVLMHRAETKSQTLSTQAGRGLLRS